MKRIIPVPIFLLFFSLKMFSQREAENWFFGSRGAVKITNPGLQNTAANTLENASVYGICSDSAGNVLFYTNGYFINNRLNITMSNSESSYSYVYTLDKIKIIRHPGNLNKYFIFKSLYQYLNVSESYIPPEIYHQLMVTEIDMSLNGGRGGITNIKDSILTDSSGAFEIIQHANKRDAWLVTKKYKTDTFTTRLISTSGLSAAPVICKAGALTAKSRYRTVAMNASNDGSLLGVHSLFANCILCRGDNKKSETIEVFSFDKTNGTFVSRNLAGENAGSFTEIGGNPTFSPDNRLMYSMTFNGWNGLATHLGSSFVCNQFNLCYTDPEDFTLLKQKDVMYVSNYTPVGQNTVNIRLAPNKLILSSPTAYTKKISAITMPNIIGTFCSSDTNYHTVNFTGAGAGNGFPSFYHPYILAHTWNNIVYEGKCQGDSLRFFITNDTITDVRWNFGDPASGSSNTSLLTKPKHRFSAPGKYTVKALMYANGSLAGSDSTWVEVKDTSIRLLYNYPADTSFCQPGKLTLKLSGINGIFRWSIKRPGQTSLAIQAVSDTFQVRSSGKYFVEFIQNGCDGCVLIDSIDVTVSPVPQINFGADRLICSGDSTQLIIDVPGSNSAWSTGSTANFIWVKQPGTYWATSWDNPACKSSDTITISSNTGIQFNFPDDTTLCANDQLVLRPGITAANYIWQNNSVADTFTVRLPGKYWVRVTKDGCVKSDTITVAYFTPGAISLGADTAICKGDNITLGLTAAADSYLWNTGAVTAHITVHTPGMYWIKTTQAGCSITDTIIISYKTLPAFSLGADTSICENSNLTLNASVTNAGSYTWSNGASSPQISISQSGIYWCDVVAQGCTYRDSITLGITQLPVINLGADTTLCEGNTLQLNASDTNVTYHWQDGSTAALYTVNKSGIYKVVVNRDGCTASGTVTVNYNLKPRFSLGGNQLICAGEAITLKPIVDPAWQLTWNDGSHANTYIVTKPGSYYLEAVGNCGTGREDIEVTQGQCKIYIPSAFTPGGSSINNTFKVLGTSLVKNFHLRVFNRFGQLVFETNDKNRGWDGTYKNTPCDTGAYIYLLQYSDDTVSKTKLLKGNFLLIR